MKSHSLRALAVVGLAAGAWAGPSGTDEWLSLDREIERLSAGLPARDDPGGYAVSGWIRSSYNSSSDFQTAAGDDLGGFLIEGIRINFKGSVGAYDIKVSIDSRGGDFKLKDGYARFALTDDIHAQMGQFKSRFLFSSYASDEKLVLYRRTLIGEAWRERDPGVQLDAEFGPFIAVLQAQNGHDEAGNELALTAKAIWAAIGKPLEKQSGCYGPDAETALTLGLGYFDDGGVDDGTAYSAEAQFVSGPVWANAEIVDAGDDIGSITKGVAKNAGLFSGATPWTATLACMLTEKFELAARYAEGDDDNDTSAVTGGVTYYAHGHAAKWQLNYITTDSDDPDLEGDIVVLGLTVII